MSPDDDGIVVVGRDFKRPACDVKSLGKAVTPLERSASRAGDEGGKSLPVGCRLCGRA
jgi:hypothetical protein